MASKAQVGSDRNGVASQPSFLDLELAVLDYWAGDRTVQASIEARPAGENGTNEYVFSEQVRAETPDVLRLSPPA